MAFESPENGFYFLKTKLASNCPPEGVEYILGISDPDAMMLTSLLVRVKGDIARDFSVRGEMKTFGIRKDLFPDHSNIIYPDTHCYKFNGLPESQVILVRVYEGRASASSFLAERNVYLLPRFLNEVTIDLSDPNFPDPVQTRRPFEETGYYEIIESYLKPLPSNLPYGDMDPDFFPEDDYDGDLLNNIEEALFYGSHAQYPTIPLSLHKGINLFYFPSIYEVLNIVPNDVAQVFHYNTNSETWNERSLDFGLENTFNAIHASGAGMLYLDLRTASNPVLHLKGFSRPGYKPDEHDPYEYLDANLFDPCHFGPEGSGYKILNHNDFNEIEAISSRNFRNGAWKSSYRFFGRTSGEDTHFYSCPYDIHLIHKGK
jgi:hypothetical protein